MSNLRLSLVQADMGWQDAPANRQLFTEMLAQLPPTDVIILPEMFTTGFSMDAAALAEDMSGPSIFWLQDMAARHDALVGGSLIIQENNAYYNRFVLAQPDGTLHTYDKRHTFRMAKEHEVYASGHELTYIDWRGWRILPLVCYDLRFPVWSRNVLADPARSYDLALYVASWPQARSSHWQKLLAARAIENQAYVAGINRCGTDGNGIAYSGNTAVYDYHGEVAAGVAPHTVGACTTVLNKGQLDAWRSKFPAWMDADGYSLL